MALNPGDVHATAGATKRVLDYLVANKVQAALVRAPTDDLSAATRDAMAALAYALVKGVFDELMANGVVTVNVPADASGDGLQTSTNAGNPTTHPSTPKTITGSIT